MFSDLAVLHRSGSHSFQWTTESLREPVFLWQTCLRKMAFGATELVSTLPVEPGDERLAGLEAYQLCLEIACGLRSPLVGETEVLGQFKSAFLAFEPPPSPWGAQLRRFSRLVLEDAKKVRQAHLDSLGSQSYGSVVRRELKGSPLIHVMGAGQLVVEMLPWLAKDGVRVVVHARNPEKARASLAAVSSRVEVCGLRDGRPFEAPAVSPLAGAGPQRQAVVIAAPAGAATVEAWLAQLRTDGQPLTQIVDLRADSAEDRLDVAGAKLVTLPDAMALVDANQERVQERKRAALAYVAQLVQERARHVENRPFGWEDVCA